MTHEATLKLETSEAIDSLEFVSDSARLRLSTWASGASRRLRLYDIPEQRFVEGFLQRGAQDCVLGRDGQTVAFAQDRAVLMTDLVRQEPLREFGHHPEGVGALALSPDGRRLATGSADRTVRLFETTTSRLEQTLQDHLAAVRAVAFAPDGQTLASGDNDGVVKLWHVETGRLLFDLPRLSGRCQQIAFTADGTRLVCRSEDRKIWEFRTADEVPPEATQ